MSGHELFVALSDVAALLPAIKTRSTSQQRAFAEQFQTVCDMWADVRTDSDITDTVRSSADTIIRATQSGITDMLAAHTSGTK